MMWPSRILTGRNSKGGLLLTVSCVLLSIHLYVVSSTPDPEDRRGNPINNDAPSLPEINNKVDNIGSNVDIKAKPVASSSEQRPPPLLLSTDPNCVADIARICDKNILTNNFAVLDCVQNSKKEEYSDVSSSCQTILWSFKKNLTQDDKFLDVAKRRCSREIEKLSGCGSDKLSPAGQMLSCLMDIQENITNAQCKQFLLRMETIVFSDYRLIYKFADACDKEIKNLQCGRVKNNADESLTHSQGATIECLSKHANNLGPNCQHEILRIAEIQSVDYHLDRPLYFACRDDREHLCSKVSAGEGRIYRCLMQHKSDKDMSRECYEQLTRRQKLVSLDYKVSRGLSKACRDDIRAYRCRENTSKNRDFRLAQILICLENARHKGYPIVGECEAEMLDHRRSLLEDYKLSPDVVRSCEDDIVKFCNEELEVNGRTIHCLMEHSRPTGRKKKRISDSCKRELEKLVLVTDAGEDWRADPVLMESCQSVVDVACKNLRPGEGRVLSCLLDNIGSDHMVEECEESLLQIQYFVARDYRLDPELYRKCHKDAKDFCGAPEDWESDMALMGPKRGPLFPCLFRYTFHPLEDHKMSIGCVQEVRRVMRQRAVSVDLHPEIEAACILDLADRCLDKVKKGEEMVCLQDNLENLSDDCKNAVRNYTEEEAEHVELNPLLYRACEPFARKFCEDIVSKDVDHGDIMQCLLQHINDYSLRGDNKCRVVLEHFQLISLKDYRFSYKFKEACKKDIFNLCKTSTAKSEMVSCLSSVVLNDTLREQKPRVSNLCRRQLRVELLQRNENIQLDPVLETSCKLDRKKFCSGISAGGGQVLECLKDNQKFLTNDCYAKIFNRQREEMFDSAVDYTLNTACKRMLKVFCDGDPGDALSCLKRYKADSKFDSTCRAVVLRRMAQQNMDYRLNPSLRKACLPDVKKFCSKIIAYEKDDHVYEGKVIACLKDKFLVHRLRTPCEKEVSRIVSEAQLDFKQDPILFDACKNETKHLCPEVDETEDNGQIEECLKINFQNNHIENFHCRQQVAKLIREGSVDVHVDPLLLKACVMDVQHFCSSIAPGEGKQLKCLLETPGHLLQEDCRTMLNKRVQLYESAAREAPLENVRDVVDHIANSPFRNYFVIVMLAIIGSIFIGGLFCGRFTKRVHYDMKRK